MKSTWKKYLLYTAYVLIGGGILYSLLQLMLAGYSVSWTGFGERTLSNGDIVGEKSLWDWMELLIIPFVLALGAFFLNRSERDVERQIAEERRKEDRKLADERAQLEREIAIDRQQEAALQTYFDRMSELLLKEKLRTTKKAEVSDVARTRTLSIMRVLDTKRNNLVLQFLREAKLIIDEKSIFNNAFLGKMNLERLHLSDVYFLSANLRDANLQGADLRDANLTGADLSGADLTGADLRGAKLTGADLSHASLQATDWTGANLSGVDLTGADLSGADLSYTNLGAASLWHADLHGADLSGTNLETSNLHGADLLNVVLEDANLDGAKVTEEQLAKVESLKGATMPDGTIHE
jgi:uncharacterized protein YjbI with pentapeptide repeats